MHPSLQDLRHRILSSDQATQLMWMPASWPQNLDCVALYAACVHSTVVDKEQSIHSAEDIVITNVEIEGQQVVSTSIYVDDSGNVNKTQRVLVRIKETA